MERKYFRKPLYGNSSIAIILMERAKRIIETIIEIDFFQPPMIFVFFRDRKYRQQILVPYQLCGLDFSINIFAAPIMRQQMHRASTEEIDLHRAGRRALQ